MFLIKNIEKIRIKQYNLKKKNEYIKYPLILSGDYIIIWYINREKEKGLIRYQFNKGVCMSIKYNGYNTTFQLRSIIDDVAIEQQFFFYSRNNILISSKKNLMHYYRSNNLKFLRKKKNKKSKFLLV
jgi:ribosomal protein L19